MGTVDQIFWKCVQIIEYLGDLTGLGYELTNILLFVVIQPLLILVFLYLWIREKRKNKYLTNTNQAFPKSKFRPYALKYLSDSNPDGPWVNFLKRDYPDTIFVFDPLAISLVVAANFAFTMANRKNLYQEYEQDLFTPEVEEATLEEQAKHTNWEEPNIEHIGQTNIVSLLDGFNWNSLMGLYGIDFRDYFIMDEFGKMKDFRIKDFNISSPLSILK